MGTTSLESDYPWICAPLIVCAPMRLIALHTLAVSVSAAGGLGFIGAGSDASILASELDSAHKEILKNTVLAESLTETSTLPIGVGFLLWAGDDLRKEAIKVLGECKAPPAAVWLFAPAEPEGEVLAAWAREVREVTQGKTAIWVQVGTVKAATEAMSSARPEVLVVQGGDAGGHGLLQSAGLVALVPEVCDAVKVLCEREGDIGQPSFKMPHILAAGGISDARGVAAAVLLGAEGGAVLGTRYLATTEANIAPGYQNAVLEASDGGVTTARTKLYDSLRGTTAWPDTYGGRGVLNASWRDAQAGLTMEENKARYDAAMKLGDEGWKGEGARLTTYAGAGVGLVTEIQLAGQVTKEVREGARKLLRLT